MKRDFEKAIAAGKKNVNPNYELCTYELQLLYEKYGNRLLSLDGNAFFDIVSDCFSFGYEMGRRATLSELRK